MEFKSLDSQSLIAKNNYNLLQLKESEFKPVILEIDEVVSCIVQHNKTGRIFYSSHCDNFINVRIKELTPMVDGLMGNLMDSIRNMAISTFGMNYGNSNKRLKSTNTDDLSQNPLSKVIKSVAPSISYFFNQKKMVESIKFDEQRNIMYILQQQLKNG
jgi:hypothetical protein